MFIKNIVFRYMTCSLHLWPYKGTHFNLFPSKQDRFVSEEKRKEKILKQPDDFVIVYEIGLP